MPTIEGVIPALLTPMDAGYRVNPPMIRALVDRMLEAGSAGVYVCGSSGEGLLLGESERRLVLETVIDAVAGKALVVAHVGSLATDEAVRLSRHAQSVGADAISAVPPFAFGRHLDGLKAHYGAIGAATHLPLYLYSITSLTSVHVSADTVRKLLDLPNVRGMKYSDQDLCEEFQLIQLGKSFDVFHGNDTTLLFGLMLGAVGGIGLTYNFMPTLYVEIEAAHRQGDYERAKELQIQAARFIQVFHRHGGGNPIGLAKALMRMIGLDCGPARLPNPTLDEATARAFKRDLDRLEFFWPRARQQSASTGA